MATADDPTGDLSWQQRAVDRSLSSARARAVSRSGQILDAARSLMLETGGIDFTVQDIVDRSGLSLRSFYKHFAGKDELLLALIRTAMGVANVKAEYQLAIIGALLIATILVSNFSERYAVAGSKP